MLSLITDRTQADVALVQSLSKKISMGTASAEELALWAGNLKGAYNYIDLNRVTAAMEYLVEQLNKYGYSVDYTRIEIEPGRYEWRGDKEKSDIPTESQMIQYLQNVLNIYNVLLSNPELPATMAQLDYNGANQIEKALLIVEETINSVVKSMCRSNAFTFWSGNRPLPSADSDFGRTWEELDAMNVPWENLENADWYLLAYGNLGVTK